MMKSTTLSKSASLKFLRRQGGSAESHSGRIQGRFVAGTSVLISGNADVVEDEIDSGAVDLLVAEVDQDEMIVRSAADDAESVVHESLRHALSVLDHLLLVFLVGRRHALLEGNGDSGDLMIVRTALETGKDGLVDGALHVVENVLASFRVHRSTPFLKKIM